MSTPCQLALKTVQVLAAIPFLGTGLGSAFFEFRAYRSGELAVMAFEDRPVVVAIAFFTIPAGIALPATGLWRVHLLGIGVFAPWVLARLVPDGVAGLTR